jgi:hypothetical protein
MLTLSKPNPSYDIKKRVRELRAVGYLRDPILKMLNLSYEMSRSGWNLYALYTRG